MTEQGFQSPRSDIDDLQLLQDFRAGDLQAFEHLYQRYRQSLFLFLMRRGHRQVEAEELFHDCWLRVIDHQQGFTGNQFRAWLYTIARNLSIDAMRKQQPQALDESTAESPALQSPSTQQVTEGVDCVELIKRSVAELPLEQRDVFLLQHEAGLSLPQIADIMQLGRETVKSRVRYAMQKLRQLMADCL